MGRNYTASQRRRVLEYISLGWYNTDPDGVQLCMKDIPINTVKKIMDNSVKRGLLKIGPTKLYSGTEKFRELVRNAEVQKELEKKLQV